MTSRERIAAVLRFERPDRMPIDLGGMRSTGIHAFALRELQARLGKDPSSVKVYDCGQFLGWPYEALRARFHLDVVALEPPNRNTESDDWHRWEPRPGFSFLMPDDFRPELQPDGSWVLTDKSGNRASRMPGNGFYFDDVDSPLAVRPMVSVKDYAPASSYEDEWLDSLSRRADWLWRNTDCAILGSAYGGGMFSLNIGGMVNWMEMLVTEPERAREYVEKCCQ
jgi:uroporphyrinogen decarboxylase